MNKIQLSITPVILLLAMTACTTAPERYDAVEDARDLVEQVRQDPLATQAAANDLKQAQQALNSADAAISDRESSSEIVHYAYIANRHAEIALERIGEARALNQIKTSEAERNKVLLSARTREAENANELINQKDQQLRQSQLEAERSRELAEQRNQQMQQSEREAALARDRADMALAEARILQEEMTELKAEQTVRGLVMTLNGGVLFDTDKAVLKPGAEISMDRLAAFLKEHPERNLMIEGHTDSEGEAAYNVALSTKRADAVRAALMQREIEADRIRSNGLGETYPVATNDSNTGRQLNRRVEVVISDQQGQFPAEAQRSAHAN